MYCTHRTKSVTVERALGVGGGGGRHGDSDEGEDKDTQNNSEFNDSGIIMTRAIHYYVLVCNHENVLPMMTMKRKTSLI